MNEKSVFENLYVVEVKDRLKEKNGLIYLPWAAAWAEVKKVYPNATWWTENQIMDTLGNERFWHDDGKSGWVVVTVKIDNIQQSLEYPIMNFKNQAMPADAITSVEANKAMMRGLAKCIGLCGLGINVYMGEEFAEETSKIAELKENIKSVIDKKVAYGDKTKAKVAELCKEAQRLAFPTFSEDLITGDYKKIDDSDILNDLHNKLLAVRKEK